MLLLGIYRNVATRGERVFCKELRHAFVVAVIEFFEVLFDDTTLADGLPDELLGSGVNEVDIEGALRVL